MMLPFTRLDTQKIFLANHTLIRPQEQSIRHPQSISPLVEEFSLPSTAHQLVTHLATRLATRLAI